MAYSNGFFDTMMEQAMREVASGKDGWQTCDTNTLMLACFGHLSKSIVQSVTKPMWFFASTLAAGIIWLLISDIFNLD